MQTHQNLHQRPYLRLFIMTVISFVLMYFFMFAMVNVWGNVIPNYNQVYMAGMMVAPMVVLELLLMKSMYSNTRWNAFLILGSLVLLFLFWTGIRQQTAIGDEQFLKSMIPHHGGAILMCEKAKLTDPDIKELCTNIISGQQSEIDFMRAKLESLK